MPLDVLLVRLEFRNRPAADDDGQTVVRRRRVQPRRPMRERSGGYASLHAGMVEGHAPPSLLINQNHDVVHVSRAVGRYLRMPGGEPTANVFKLLRDTLGAQKFDQLLRTHLQENRGKNVSIDDFEKLVTRVAGQPMRYFFARWVESTGVPEFTADYQILRTRGGKFVARGTVRQNYDKLKLPVDVQLRSEGDQGLSQVALDMQEAMRRLAAEFGEPLSLRIGLHAGPVVAGVIGQRKFSYDLWGDTVNTASRMESHGVPGRVHVTESTFKALEHEFEFEARGVVDIKGKGPMPTYLLVGRKEQKAA
jgi:class 3 adenylate cyclase